MIYLPLYAVGNHYLFILAHVYFSEIRETIPGRDERSASVSADQPCKQLKEELTTDDYSKGKL